MVTLHQTLRPLLADSDSEEIGGDRKIEPESAVNPSSELAMHVDAPSDTRPMHLLFPSQRSLR